jgi:pimeloyl-ACP methyl ester carboxylesterase
VSASILRFVSAEDGTEIAWRTHVGGGNDEALRAKRAIVLTNGLSTTDNFWSAIVAGLGGENRVVHWSYRGHGESQSARSKDYTIRTHVADLARVTEAVRAYGRSELPPVHVAFSMGVTVLLELYRARPELVGGMVLVAGGADHPHASSAFFRVPGMRKVVQGAMRLAAPIVPHASPLARRVAAAKALFPMARAVGAIGKDAPREEVEHFFRTVGAMDLEAYWESMRALMDAHASDMLGEVKVPVLIVAPERDVLAARGDLLALRDGIPGAEWVIVPRTTHAMLLEAGGVVAEKVTGFVERAIGMEVRASTSARGRVESDTQ